ncbi:MAG: hypothetical protein R2882_05605 [Gemmatimonadales bacterium]
MTGLIDRVEDADPELFAAICSGRAYGREPSCSKRETPILFRVGLPRKTSSGLAAVLAELAKSRMAVAEVDARFRGRVIVRGRP